MHLVLGVLVVNSMVPTNVSDIDTQGPPTSQLPRNFLKLIYMFLKEKKVKLKTKL